MVRFKLSVLVLLRTNFFFFFPVNAPSKIYRRICSSPLNLSASANLQSVTKFVPSLIIAIFTCDLWPDHYQCVRQLVEDDTCRRTTLLLFGFTAGKVINALSKWTLSKSLASLLFGFHVAQSLQGIFSRCLWIDWSLWSRPQCLDRPLVNLLRAMWPQKCHPDEKFAAELIVG